MVETSDDSDRLETLNSQFQSLLDAAVDGIVMIDDRGRIELFNKAAERIFGYDAQDLVGENVSCLMPAPYCEEHDRYIERYLDTKEKKIIGIGRDVSGKRRNGEIFPMNLAVGEVSRKGKPQFVGLVRDLSDVKRIEERLDTLDQEFRFVFDRAPVGVLISRFDGALIMANPWLAELLGFTEGELRQARLPDLVSGEDQSPLAELLESLGAGAAKSGDLNTRLISKAGESCYVNIHANVVSNATSEGFILALVIDRTAEIARLANASEAQERLAHSDRLNSLGEMASAIAHEINQPLAAITAYSQACTRLLAAAHTDQSDEIESVLGKISEQAQRGGEIIRRIRGFATKSNNERVLADVNDEIRKAVALVQANANASKVRISLGLNENLPRVLADEIQIQQVCINLIRNAIDAMVGNTSATRSLHIQSERIGSEIDVSFDDEGPGVPEEIRARLFEPFQSSKSGGLGLGLSISHKIISDHHGTLEYQPLTNGTRFRFRLPVATV